jgi:sugar lactone lactonase YvrE
MLQVELVNAACADLGEGPAWDAASERLYWVDLRAGVLHCHDPRDGSENLHRFPESLGCIAPCCRAWKSPAGESGLAIAALKSGIVLLKRLPDEWDLLAQPEAFLPGNRFNDGKCDPAGRFLAGTMDNAEKAASGSLYSYSPQGELKTLLTGLHISNGLTWSPDGRTFYFIDTPTRQVTAFDYDLATGDIFSPRPVVVVPPRLGWPDGMTSDSRGMLWVAMWGGACLTCWDPSNGRLLEEIPVPALQVSSCVFAGLDLTDLYITSARKGMSPGKLAKYPLSGSLFRLRTGIRGLPTYEFGAALSQ